MKLTLEENEKEYLQKVWNVYGNRSQFRSVESLAKKILSIKSLEVLESHDISVVCFIITFVNTIVSYYYEHKYYPSSFKEIFNIIIEDQLFDPFTTSSYLLYDQTQTICNYLEELQQASLIKQSRSRKK